MARILIVDDEPILRRTFRLVLGREHTYFEASDGVEALHILEEQNIDLVLSDWNMPCMDGLTMLRTLRNRGNKVMVGLLSGRIDALREQSEGEACFYLGKPFLNADLRSVVEKALHNLPN
jgi:CheY-like chemotaxis protein